MRACEGAADTTQTSNKIPVTPSTATAVGADEEASAAVGSEDEVAAPSDGDISFNDDEDRAVMKGAPAGPGKKSVGEASTEHSFAFVCAFGSPRPPELKIKQLRKKGIKVKLPAKTDAAPAAVSEPPSKRNAAAAGSDTATKSKAGSGKDAKPKASSDKAAKPKDGSDKDAKPKAGSDKAAKPKASSDKAAEPKTGSDKAAKPKAGSDKAAKPKASVAAAAVGAKRSHRAAA